MTSINYRWRFTCTTENTTVEVVQNAQPTQCPNGATHTMQANSLVKVDTVPPSFSQGLQVLPNITLANGTFSGMYSELTGVPFKKIYNNITSLSQCTMWYGTSTATNGVATFYPTVDGTSTGTPIFTQIIHVNCSAWNNSSTITQAPLVSGKSISSNNSIVVVNVLIGTSVVVGGSTVTVAPTGTTVMCSILGV